MAKISPAEIKVSRLTQVGIVVEDVEKVAENYWNILGIGPWRILTFPPPHMYDRRYYGKPAYFVPKVALAQLGQVELELMQSVEGHTLYDDFYMEHGEGANHVQYLVDSAEEVYRHIDIMTKKGMPALMNGRFGDNGAFAYFDTIDALKTIWEPVKTADNFDGPTKTYPADPSVLSPAKITIKEIWQISLMVKDIEETMKNYWEIFGIGPWEVLNCVRPNWHDNTYYGKQANYTMLAALTKVGDVELELIQRVSGDNLYLDHICEHGEGIHHIGIQVDDVAEMTRIMESEGFPCVQGGKVVGGCDWAYYDTTGPLKIYWEAFKPPATALPVSARYPE